MDLESILDLMDVDSAWTSFERRLARETVRRWLAGMQYREGLLARRVWGAAPEASADPFTGEPVDLISPAWGEASYTGPYEQGFMAANLGGDATAVQPPRGLQNAVVLAGLMVPFGKVSAGDVWRDGRSGRVHEIRPAGNRAVVGRIPVVVETVLFELPDGRPEYDLSLWDESSP